MDWLAQEIHHVSTDEVVCVCVCVCVCVVSPNHVMRRLQAAMMVDAIHNNIIGGVID